MQRILFILPQLRGTQHSPPPNRHSRLRVANNQHRLRSCRASLGTAATERGARILERCRRQVRHRSHHLQPAQPRTQRHQAQLNIHSLVWHWVIIVSIPKPFVISDNSSQSIYGHNSRGAEDEVRQPRARALVEPDARERHNHTERVGEHVAHRANHRRVLSVDLRQHARRLVQMPSLVSGNLFRLDGLDRAWTRGSGSPVKTVKAQVKQQRLS